MPPQVGHGIPRMDLMGHVMCGSVCQGNKNAVIHTEMKIVIQIQRLVRDVTGNYLPESCLPP